MTRTEWRRVVRDLMDHLTAEPPLGHGMTIVADPTPDLLNNLHWYLHQRAPSTGQARDDG